MTTVLHRQGNPLAWTQYGRSVIAPIPPSPTPWLPFDMPNRSVLAASGKWVLAHYFPTFPVAIGSGDYWTKWMPPGEVEGSTDHRVYGGYVRDRKPNDTDRTGNFDRRMKLAECIAARDAGLDGFTLEMVSITSGNSFRTRCENLLGAVEDMGDPTFRVIPMPDGNTAATSSAVSLGDYLATIASRSSIFRNASGRMLLTAFGPEKAPNKVGTGGSAAATFWQQVLARLSTLGHPTDFMPCYVNSWTATAQAPSFDSISWGHSRWGDRDPANNANETNNNRNAPAYCRATFGKKWMHWASPQDVRPYSGSWWEAHGSRALHEAFRAAIDGGADFIQIPTWDDFSESAFICPTVDSGNTWLDLVSYYTTWFKMGAAPTIMRDAIYLFHRKHLTTGATFTSAFQTEFHDPVSGGTSAKNDIEARVFLTEDADVEILIDGVVQGGAQACTAGMTSVTRPLAEGVVSARIVRDAVTVASVTSPHEVNQTQLVQDFVYRGVSSLRS